jgi:hypothetical protein
MFNLGTFVGGAYQMHDFDCGCKECLAEAEDGLDSMFPNAETDEELEEAMEHEWSRMLDR